MGREGGVEGLKAAEGELARGEEEDAQVNEGVAVPLRAAGLDACKKRACVCACACVCVRERAHWRAVTGKGARGGRARKHTHAPSAERPAGLKSPMCVVSSSLMASMLASVMMPRAFLDSLELLMVREVMLPLLLAPPLLLLEV